MTGTYKYTILSLFLLPLLIMACKTVQMGGDLSPLLPEKQYRVSYEFMYNSSKEKVFVKAFVPQVNEHQSIQVNSSDPPEISFKVKKGPNGHRARWEKVASSKDSARGFSLFGASEEIIRYTFTYSGREITYLLDNKLPVDQFIPDSLRVYLAASKYIQSEDPLIERMAIRVSKGKKDLKKVLGHIYEYIYDIPRIKSSELMDAKTCLKGQKASCNGRSRLFVAMARSLGIPARLVGGIILETGSKRTSHQWVEVYVQGSWIPFDALNGHFAHLPAHYMELYKGDEFLITHTPGIEFDWMFHIEEEILSSQRAEIQVPLSGSPFLDPFLSRLSLTGMPISFMKILLLLPVLGLVVTLCKNVVGLKTIGTFLPAILGISLHYSGMLNGFLMLGTVILWVVLMYKPLEAWGMLQSPKLVVLLTGVVFIILLFSLLETAGKQAGDTSMNFFPIVILTFLSERFARKLDEEGLIEAGKLLGQTLVVAIACFIVYSASFLESLLMTFPELLLAVMGTTLLVGKWIGLRVVEYVRFRKLVFEKNK